MNGTGRGTAANQDRQTTEDSHRVHIGRTPALEGFGKPMSGSIPTTVRSYKSSVTSRIKGLRNRPDHPVWQRNYYEHVVLDDTDRQSIETYIINNPLLWDQDQNNPHRI